MACEIYGYTYYNYLHCFIYYHDDICLFYWNAKTIHAKT